MATDEWYKEQFLIVLKEIRDTLKRVEENTAPSPRPRWTVGTPWYDDSRNLPAKPDPRSTGYPLPLPNETIS